MDASELAPAVTRIPLQVKDEGILLFEYVRLPIADLTFHFLWRFTAPVPTAWQADSVSVLTLMDRRYSVLSMFMLQFAEEQWKALEAAQYLKPITTSHVTECVIVPKEAA